MVVCHAGMTDKTDMEPCFISVFPAHFPLRIGTLSEPLALLIFIFGNYLIAQLMLTLISEIWKQFLTGRKVLHVFISEDRLELLL